MNKKVRLQKAQSADRKNILPEFSTACVYNSSPPLAFAKTGAGDTELISTTMFYSQKDKRWANLKLGTSTTTFGSSSCKITSLGNLIGKTPVEVNEIMLEHNAYFKQCLSEDVSTAEALGLGYEGVVYKAPECVCIAETHDYSVLGVPQHFFLYHNGLIVDPLEEKPDWKKNCYNIFSYRLFKLNKMQDTITEILYLFKEIYDKQNDEDKTKIVAIGKKIRVLQEALGLEVSA